MFLHNNSNPKEEELVLDSVVFLWQAWTGFWRGMSKGFGTLVWKVIKCWEHCRQWRPGWEVWESRLLWEPQIYRYIYQFIKECDRETDSQIQDKLHPVGKSFHSAKRSGNKPHTASSCLIWSSQHKRAHNLCQSPIKKSSPKDLRPPNTLVEWIPTTVNSTGEFELKINDSG